MNLFVGFDMGGTSIKHVLINRAQQIIEVGSLPTHGSVAATTISSMVEVARSYASRYHGDLRGVGVGCTGPVNIETGEIQNPYTLPGFEGHSLIDTMKPELGVDVVVENDTNAAHMGEVSYTGSQQENSIMVTFGTGVGVSVRLGGKLFRTPGAIHPEIGHIPVGVSSDTACYCKKTRCFEHVMSGTAINRFAMETFGCSPEEVLREPESTDAKVFLDRLVTATTDAITTLAVIFQPSVVFVGGGMHEFFAKNVLIPVQVKLNQLLPIYGRTKLVEAKMGQIAGCFGAATIAREHAERLYTT